jgi:ketosteroid isomerase-like protein
MRNETQIRELYARYVDAARRRDLDGIMDCYSEDVVAFDLMPPLQHRNSLSFRKAWKAGFGMSKSFDAELTELDITADDEIAFVHAILHTNAVGTDDKPFETWMRYTGGLKKIDGRWKIVHEQTSVPIDPASMKPLMNLRP